ncbi:hypothetical protein N0V82_007547 [Gnomoniopsis sp. IMI 355080]|nr:hypothetical protein N0V82_007547 [Gnomoniopsis sp. IMI 355080]
MAGDGVAPSLRAEDSEPNKVDTKIVQNTLGDVRLRHHETNEIILVPTPSADPNDPLNWPLWYKRTIATIVCVAMLWCNFLAAGPTVAIVQTTLEFFPGSPPTTDPVGFSKNIASVSYFFTTTALLQGTGNFIWVPIANKYGRRPTYVISYTIYLACAIWAIFDKSFGGFLAARILMGFGAGAAETIAPITISDVFFLHERGTVMALYTSFLSAGVAFGMIISGGVSDPLVDADAVKASTSHTDIEQAPNSQRYPKRKSYLQTLSIFSGTYTDEPLIKIFLRPLGLICLPPVLWSALVESVTIGFLVAVSSNVDTAFEAAYGFESWQVGLCFISACIGAVIGIPAGGQLGDLVADYLTRKNGGIRKPEMRLPAMIPSLITTPLALILYGVGIQKKLHWICPTIGLGLLNFSIVQGTNICLVYVIDAYRPVAGEVTLAVMGFKSLFGFLLSFYTNPWIDSAGYQNAYGAMAGISASIIVLWVPLYLWGARIRHATWEWPIMSTIHWDQDREVGE